MERKSASINLRQKKKVDVIEKFLGWALSVGRLLIIITECVALFAFLSRFSLDSQIIDLHDEIKKKETIVSLYQKNEDMFRNIQDRLKLASQFGNNASSTVATLIGILKLAPTNRSITFGSISFSANTLKMEVNAQSEQALKNFIDTLLAYPNVQNVSLNNIENRTSNATLFANITIEFKK